MQRACQKTQRCALAKADRGRASGPTPLPPVPPAVERRRPTCDASGVSDDHQDEPAASQPVRVFISCSHDSDQHRERVLDLAQRLRGDGVDCTIDQFVNGSPPEGWPLWMERQVELADVVNVVAAEPHVVVMGSRRRRRLSFIGR